MSERDKSEQPSVAVKQHNADDAARSRVVGRPFRPGQSGNPKGRPLGSRVKLEEIFVADMVEAWKLYGKEALERTAQKEPSKFAQIAASVLPKQTQNTRIHKLELMTDKELAELLEATDAQIEGAMIGRQGMN
jgi:hypothetical protein